jgi:bifunctional UDP-N-acetylglucosamine pyrophosphorylase/glucosamine-1-phosphate N-acetyltransferase
MEKLCCVILAAGMGKRMGGDAPKALSSTREKPLIDHALDALAPLKPVKTIIVTGHKRELLEEYLKGSASASSHSISFSLQETQLGTGHAVQCALPQLKGFEGTVIITYADHPLFKSETLSLLCKYHVVKKATLTMVTFKAPVPNNYGRIVRDATQKVMRITEAKDCSVEESLIEEVNSGIYAVDSAFLTPAIQALQNNNAQKEYYLTDIVEKAAKEGQRVEAFLLPDAEEAGGVNSPVELQGVNRILERRQVAALMQSGVLLDDPDSLFIDASVKVAPRAHIGPNVQLRGNTVIEEGVRLEGTQVIINSKIGKDTVVKLGSRIEDSVVGRRSSVGPFANLRPGTFLGEECRIGNFVETKNAQLSNGAKASHLTYLGDCTVGTDTNIGAGTITCNYDGYNKSKTTIGAGVFIGSNSALVAPLTIGDGALIAAGSTITKNVPVDALAVSRAQQEMKEGWASKRRKLLSERKKG